MWKYNGIKSSKRYKINVRKKNKWKSNLFETIAFAYFFVKDAKGIFGSWARKNYFNPNSYPITKVPTMRLGKWIPMRILLLLVPTKMYLSGGSFYGQTKKLQNPSKLHEL